MIENRMKSEHPDVSADGREHDPCGMIKYEFYMEDKGNDNT